MIIDVSQLTVEILERLLRPCLAWCADSIDSRPQGMNVSKAFRSSELRVEANLVFPDSCHTPFSPQLARRFDDFLRKRAALSTTQLANRVVLSETTRDRSLLITDWNASLFDGALTPETEGFIDEYCMPPWDTWVALVRSPGSIGEACLLSWIPPWMSDKVDFGIEVDAAECLSWLRLAGDVKPILTGWGVRWAA